MRGGVKQTTTSGGAAVTEQLRFDQRRRSRGAVQGDERRPAALAGGVQCPRHQFLAGAGFAFDEHRQIGLGRGGDAGAEGAHRIARAD